MSNGLDLTAHKKTVKSCLLIIIILILMNSFMYLLNYNCKYDVKDYKLFNS